MDTQARNLDSGMQNPVVSRHEEGTVATNEDYVENDTQEAKAGLVSYHIRREVNGFDKQHHMLASASLDTGDVANRIVLHYWAPNSAPVVMPTMLTMDHLQLIHGLQGLGSIFVPVAASLSPASLADHIYNMPCSVLTAGDGLPAVDYENDLMEKIGKAAAECTATRDHHMIPFSLYRLPVWGRNEHHLLRHNSSFKLWNWHKPESPYQKEGIWTDDLQTLLTSAEKIAGGNLRLFLRGGNLTSGASTRA
ncbi:hypothetical protein PWT90_03946 [Aphanocladium album]|nr:hypothetical protein PWT90_03946 [Aphanocladium album]